MAHSEIRVKKKTANASSFLIKKKGIMLWCTQSEISREQVLKTITRPSTSK